MSTQFSRNLSLRHHTLKKKHSGKNHTDQTSNTLVLAVGSHLMKWQA